MDRLAFVLALLLASPSALAQPPFPPEIVPDAYELGVRAERDGNIRTAIEYYTQAARRREAAAADRLAEIYDQGHGGVRRDQVESLKWRNVARRLRGEPLASTLSLYEQGEAAERAGDGRTAVNLYVRAARGGDARAARRLSQIYDKGAAGVLRDHQESLKWDNAARVLGEPLTGDFPNRPRREPLIGDFPNPGGRPGGSRW